MKILIIDDHDIVRQGVRRLLGALPSAEITEAVSVDEAMTRFEADRPSVVILDINLGGASGLDVLERILSVDPQARVVMFSMHADAGYASRALKAGAVAFVSKSASADELVEAVKSVLAGRRFVDRRIAAELAAIPKDGDPLDALTNRESEILRLLGEGRSLNEIATTFGIAYKTVANTCTRMKEKLGVERTADLIRISIERMGPRAPG
ncbi:MAG: response regulator transcription factor [Hyphomicrobium sp.]|nr:response regulator transcription factor [Hyphomicrobium sp.]